MRIDTPMSREIAEALLACPFHEPTVAVFSPTLETEISVGDHTYPFWWVRCRECDVTTQKYTAPEFAIQNWNGRNAAAITEARKEQREKDARIAEAAAEESGKLAEQYWREGDRLNARVRQGWCSGANKSAAAIRAEGVNHE